MNEIEVFKKQVLDLKKPSVEVTQGSINFDLSILKENVLKITEKVNELEITNDTVEEFEKLHAAINHIANDINEDKKTVKKDYNKVYNEYEAEVKDIINILNNANKHVDSQLNIYRNKVHQDRVEELTELWNKTSGISDIVPFERIENPKWYLKTFSNKKIEIEMHGLVEKFNKDCELIRASVDNEQEANKVIANYYNSLDVAKELGEYTKWKNTIKSTINVVETTTPKKVENVVEPKLEPLKEEITTTQATTINSNKPVQVMLAFTTDRVDLVSYIEQLLKAENVKYNIRKNEVR